jgi:hypothetical protein
MPISTATPANAINPTPTATEKLNPSTYNSQIPPISANGSVPNKSNMYKKHTNKAKENDTPVDIIFERDVEMDYFKHVLLSC